MYKRQSLGWIKPHGFTSNWQMALIAFLAMSFLIYLGMWQLQRAQEKKQMVVKQASQKQQPPIQWTKGQQLPQQYQRLEVKGHYLPPIFLLDNQHHQHQFGFDVLSPLQLTPDTLVLVDRGWVAADATRNSMPILNTFFTPLQVKGYAYFPSDKTWILGEAYEKKTANMIIIERIDTQLISNILHKSVYPFIIRLDNDEAQGYIRDWPIISMPPARHIGYAVQWFALAFVILILFISLNLKKN